MKKTMKKIVCTLLVVVMCLTSAPLQGFADVLTLKASAAKITSYSQGDIIEFGWYPQSKVTDSATITALNNKAPVWDNWTSYGYYTGTGSYGTMKQGDWMRYTDIMYNGNKYRGVKFTQYRPCITYSSSPTYQSTNGYNTNTVYWFKFEPIDWRVLDPVKGLVMCETIIDSQPYSNTIYSNSGGTYGYFNDSSYTNFASDYETSSIRQWLNTDFYNIAFSSAQQKIVKSTTLNNDGYHTSIGNTGYEKLDSNSTNDKIFLLSYNEVRNSNYGFNSNNSAYDPARFAQGSDYAQSQGLYVYRSSGSTCSGNSNWLLRSPGYYSDNCCSVSSDGISDYYYDVDYSDDGIRPALNFNLSSEIFQSDVKDTGNSSANGAGSTTNNIYNLGEETYSFKNFKDLDSSGHCFGMSSTSAGYYLGLLPKSNIGLANNNTLYSFELTDRVKTPICHYQEVQGQARNESIVAGGTSFKYYPLFTAKSDWKAVVDYVKDHKHDGKGDLIVGYTKKFKMGGHAVNFLRYEVVDGQERIYVYDNNFPHVETYFYQDSNGDIKQAPLYTYSSVDTIALVDVKEFFNRTGNFVMAKTFYALSDTISIDGAYESAMWMGDTEAEMMMYELIDDKTEIVITPLVDNATFKYMGIEYSFGEIDEGTYAEFTLSTSEEDEPEFEIIKHEHTYNEVKNEPTCTEDGSITYTCYCGDTYTETIEANGHTDSEWIVDSNSTCAKEGSKHIECTVCEEVLKTEPIAKLPHKYSSVVTEATCESGGYTTYTCTCGDSYIADEVSANGHTDSEWIVDKDSTCSSEGSKHIECTVCEEVLKTEAIAKLPHKYSSVVTEATCEKGGYTTYTCTCGDTYTGDKTPAKGHDYAEGVCKNCGDSKVNNCSCNCHKSGLMGFIWKLLRFFYKLFGSNKICSCGASHY